MTPFRFYLDWDLNCQFAGLIWAREKGLFTRAGLDVDLVSARLNPHTATLDLVLGGGLCAGCMEDNLIVRAAVEGRGVKAIGATMQDSPIHRISSPMAASMRSKATQQPNHTPCHASALPRT
jgi:ABC-type nitrate/sulfonate/bicarbonate transport system substrate-binding protein